MPGGALYGSRGEVAVSEGWGGMRGIEGTVSVASRMAGVEHGSPQARTLWTGALGAEVEPTAHGPQDRGISSHLTSLLGGAAEEPGSKAKAVINSHLSSNNLFSQGWTGLFCPGRNSFWPKCPGSR